MCSIVWFWWNCQLSWKHLYVIIFFLLRSFASFFSLLPLYFDLCMLLWILHRTNVTFYPSWQRRAFRIFRFVGHTINTPMLTRFIWILKRARYSAEGRRKRERENGREIDQNETGKKKTKCTFFSCHSVQLNNCTQAKLNFILFIRMARIAFSQNINDMYGAILSNLYQH